ncbi:unnamed protein product [Boreogadus saida]
MPDNVSFLRNRTDLGQGSGGGRLLGPVGAARPAWAITLLASVLIFTTVVDVLGNSLVIISVFRNRKLRNAGHVQVGTQMFKCHASIKISTPPPTHTTNPMKHLQYPHRNFGIDSLKSMNRDMEKKGIVLRELSCRTASELPVPELPADVRPQSGSVLRELNWRRS